MTKLLIVLTTVFVIFSCSDRENLTGSENPSPLNGTKIKGSLTGILQKNKSPYYVIEDIFVDSMGALVIEPGVSLFFYDSTKFTVWGTINAKGTVNSYITFTSNLNAWFGISVQNSNQDNSFQYCVFEKVIIPNTLISEYGSVTIKNSSVKVMNCVFQNNYAMNGGGICINESNVTILNNIIVSNQAESFGGAIISIKSISKIYNNTIYHNTSANYGGGLVLVEPVFDDIQNNIFYLNYNQTGDPRISIYSGDSTAYNIEYNFLWYANLNPEFVSNDNLHLKAGSPCIDQGNPQNEFNDWNGSRNDQGAYGGPYGDW
jgi:hypothetical protein